MYRSRFLSLLAAAMLLLTSGINFSLAAEEAATETPAAPPPVPLRVAIPGNIYATLEKDEPTGVFVEALDTLLKAAGFAPAYLSMPTGEAIRETAKGSIDIATVVVPVGSVRETTLLSDPFVTEYNVVVTLKGKGFALNSLADLESKRIAARVGYRYPLLENRTSLKMNRYRTDGEMIRALLYSEADVAIMSGVSDIHSFRAEGIMTRMEVLKASVGAVPLVAVFSKKRFKPEDVVRFNQELAKFKETPEWQNILDKNGLADLVREWPMLKE